MGVQDRVSWIFEDIIESSSNLMLQVIQPIDGRATEVVEAPAPICGDNEVLIVNRCSLISAGTEKSVVNLARKSLLAKARERPDHVKRVLQKVRQEGLSSTLQQVRAKLQQPMPLGYSSAGVVLEVGRGVERFRPGDRVASNGPHAAVVAVGQNLVAHVPENVSFEHAAYAVVGAIGLQSVRLAEPDLGSVVAVIGLGLIGQMIVAMLKASGCIVLGTDLDASKCELACAMGADWAETGGLLEAAAARSLGHGADAVIIAASTDSNAPLELAAKVARQKGKIVAVGAVSMDVPRRDFYPKELELVVSCSYGPGRYDPAYEDAGRDYPYPYVRWTEQRNIQAVLNLMGSGRLDVGRLTTHRFSINRATDAYTLIQEGTAPAVGVVLEYPAHQPAVPLKRRILVPMPGSVETRTPDPSGYGVGFIGAGNFASAVLLPVLGRQSGVTLQCLCSAGGLSARNQAQRLGFVSAASDHRELLDDPAVKAVFIVTRHDLHTSLLLDALRAGKTVFVEKPLALTVEELEAIETHLASAADVPMFMVGFNRRFSPAAAAVRAHFQGVQEPITATYRFNAGTIPPEHWSQDEEVGGGRIVGEACHAADLLTYLLDSPPVRVYAEGVGAGEGLRVASDRAAITLRHANGSVSTLLYAAGGDRALSKERVELFGGGRAAVIDDFQKAELVHNGRAKSLSWRGQAKGHSEEIKAFLNAARSGGAPPIPYNELFATSYAMIAAMESMRAGVPIDLPEIRLSGPHGETPEASVSLEERVAPS